MSKSKSVHSLLIPSLTVFISSACIMILELVASRLIARHLGSSLYTWTSVIGVVLAGITIGNYLGGRIADKFPARKTLAVLFGLASAACVIIVVLNNIVGEWVFLWKLSWPVRVFSHVSIVFFLPSMLLGTISPVVAKMALDKGLATGRTVGDIYAWGAAGSIAGTFLAGFYLIAAIGTIKIIWTVGAVLLVMGILYYAKLWVLYVWAVIFVILMTLGMTSTAFAEEFGAKIGVRSPQDQDILYENETQYCYVAVERVSGTETDARAFMQDKLKHSEIEMGKIENLKYHYEQIHAAATHRFAGDKKKLSTLIIGGGGYVFPRYVEKMWPGSRVDVVEIDPGVTEAAMEAFGLSRDTDINTFTMDARNYVDQLLYEEDNGGDKVRYDFIYEDALNDYSIPFQLVTKEFNDKIAILLGDAGVYLIELIEIQDSGLFLGSYIETLEQTFPHVYVVTTSDLSSAERNTFVIAASQRELDFKELDESYPQETLDLKYLTPDDINTLKINAKNIVMTDDYAPVENMMAPVVLRSATDFLSARYLNNAKAALKEGELEKSLQAYYDLLDVDPTYGTLAYNEIAMIYSNQGNFLKSLDALYKALEAEEAQEEGHRKGLAPIQYSIGACLKKLGRTEEAKKHLDLAAIEFRKEIIRKPDSAELYVRLGDSLAENEKFADAAEAFEGAVKITPYDPRAIMKLVQSLEYSNQIDKAIAVLAQSYKLMNKYNQPELANKFKQYATYLQSKKAKN